MNKNMRDLQMQIDEHVKRAELFMSAENPDSEKAAAELDAADELQKQLDTAQRIEDARKKNLPTAVLAIEPEEKTVNGYGIMAKLLRGRPLSSAELDAISAADDAEQKALVTGTNARNGENYLCPEDIENDIKEYRKSYKQMRDFVNVEPTSALSGKCFYAQTPEAGLVPFDDGNEIDASSDPNFIPVPWTIAWYGALIPVSQILEEAEAVNLKNYINKWFVRRAVISENTAIFRALSTIKQAVELVGVAAVKGAINTDIDPSCLIGGVVITNQTGFNTLDQEVDENGRGLLQPDPSQPDRKLLKGLRIEVFADTELANLDERHAPIFIGDIKSAITLKEFKRRMVAVSSHFAFNKAQDVFRIIEGFSAVPMDPTSFIFGALRAIENS